MVWKSGVEVTWKASKQWSFRRDCHNVSDTADSKDTGQYKIECSGSETDKKLTAREGGEDVSRKKEDALS